MFTVDYDDEKLNARFRAMPANVHDALLKRIYSLAVQLADRVRRKLSGDVLNVRSGDLRGSIDDTVTDTEKSITAKVFSSGDVKYAAIHEYGGVIPAHDIFPNRAQALAFVWEGRQRFFRHVHIPDVTMPERSYLRSSLTDMKQEIINGMTEAVREGLNKGT